MLIFLFGRHVFLPFIKALVSLGLWGKWWTSESYGLRPQRAHGHAADVACSGHSRARWGNDGHRVLGELLTSLWQ